MEGVHVADLAERLEGRLPETAPVERGKKRSERALVADLAERFGRGVVKPALVAAIQAGQQGLDRPGVTDLSQRLGSGDTDILVLVLDESRDQCGHGAGILEVSEDVDDELP